MNNAILVIPMLVCFVTFAANIMEHELHKPGWKPGIVFGLLSVIAVMIWPAFAR